MCELDIIFNFEKAYFMLDELLVGGEIQETSKKNVLKAIAAQDVLQEVSRLEDSHDLKYPPTTGFTQTAGRTKFLAEIFPMEQKLSVRHSI